MIGKCLWELVYYTSYSDSNEENERTCRANSWENGVQAC